MYVIEFNDAALSISNQEGLLLESPGYAVMDGNHLYLGSEAQDVARIRPRWTNNHFWSRLGVDPMPGATPQVRHHADLAFEHLKHVWEQVGEAGASVMFAVPGSWTESQLGLLLGFADELGLRVHSMVDAAVAASASSSASGNLRHLDISLHRTLLTELQAAESLTRGRVLVVAEEGLVHFNNLWANTIADQFVHATRFDPMHRAETEQILHDCLPTCLAELEEHGATMVELDDNDKHYSVTVRKDQLVAAGAAAYPRIIQQLQSGDAGTLLLSSRFNSFPGLKDALSVLPGVTIEILAPGAAAIGCLAMMDQLSLVKGNGNGQDQGEGQDTTRDDEAVHYFTELQRSADSTAVARSKATEPLPTHLLYRGQAWAISGRAMVLAVSDDVVLSGEGKGDAQCSVLRLDGQVWLEPRPLTHVELNGREVDDKVGLSIGDRLTFRGHEEPVQVISLSS